MAPERRGPDVRPRVRALRPGQSASQRRFAARGGWRSAVDVLPKVRAIKAKKTRQSVTLFARRAPLGPVRPGRTGGPGVARKGATPLAFREKPEPHTSASTQRFQSGMGCLMSQKLHETLETRARPFGHIAKSRPSGDVLDNSRRPDPVGTPWRGRDALAWSRRPGLVATPWTGRDALAQSGRLGPVGTPWPGRDALAWSRHQRPGGTAKNWGTRRPIFPWGVPKGFAPTANRRLVETGRPAGVRGRSVGQAQLCLRAEECPAHWSALRFFTRDLARHTVPIPAQGPWANAPRSGGAHRQARASLDVRRRRCRRGGPHRRRGWRIPRPAPGATAGRRSRPRWS